MNKPRKRYSVSGTLDTLSAKDPSQMQSLKNLNANILNYIKKKGIKYHNLNDPFEKDSGFENNKTKITTIKEENEETDQKKLYTYSPVHKRNKKLSTLNPQLDEKKKRSNSLKLIKKIKFIDCLLNLSKDKDLETEFSDENNISINSYMHKEIDKNNKNKNERKKSSDDIINENTRKSIPLKLLKEENLNLEKISKRRSLLDFSKEETLKPKKRASLQTLFRRYYRNLRDDQILQEKLTKFCKIIKVFKIRIFVDKVKFIQKLKYIPKKSYFEILKKNLNYHKPIVKQKRKKDSSTSLNYISLFFPPVNEIDDDLFSLPNDYTSKDLPIFSNKIFYDIEITNENSLHYRGKKLKRQNSDEILKYKRLYEMAQESLRKTKLDLKIFNFLNIRKKVVNLNIPPAKPSSFKELELENLSNMIFTIDATKINLEIEDKDKIELLAIKKNPYLWARLPFTIKNLAKKHLFEVNALYFMSYLKQTSLINKQNEILIKILKNEDLKIKRKYLREYYFKIRLIKFVEEKGKERINKLEKKNEIEFEVERDFYEPSVISDTLSENNERRTSFLSTISTKHRRNNTEYKLDYIPKIRNPKIKIQKATKPRNRLMKYLLRKERNRHRQLYYIDKNDLRNSLIYSNRKFKPVKLIKRVYDDITGNIIEFDLKQPSDNYKEEENIISKEKCKAEKILNEDKTLKMKRVLKLNELGHFFKYWKSIVIEKNKKPKFFDVINITMKCLFTDNKYVKAAFMGETYFIKGRYLFFWYRKVFGERKKIEKRNRKKK